MHQSEAVALYRAARVGGDFFEFVQAEHDRLVFVLLDIAGRRDEALNIAAAVQDMLRAEVPKSFAALDLNETDAVTDLVLSLNHTILEAAGGVRCAPGFVACYNEGLGTIAYVNAGSVPALIRSDDGSITVLEPGGLPLGLFSHATHDAQMCVLSTGSSLLLASRGLLEVKAGHEEYGIKRLKESFRSADNSSAKALCSSVLKDIAAFVEQNKRGRFFGRAGNNSNGDSLGDNDVTTLALLRSAARASATSAR
jgi:serine phosphatase RsbU (regulator of sigma subunit)